ncbi:MAG TPA: hypothetical protein PK405_09350 [Hyphomicrobiales bacterium]|nr:hypothetical protein [Rhodobiaceae bacterium]HXK54878.1 hypothetical protein [Hyphomicrobiales bacterium]
MWDFDTGLSLAALRRTMPFILLRMAVYFGITVAYVAATGLGAGIGWTFGVFGSDDFQATTTFWGGAFGIGGVSLALYWLREYILYMVKAAHIAVLVGVLDGTEPPAGRGQLEHGAAIVKDRFAEANVLFVLDRAIKAVVRMVSGLIGFVSDFLPIPGIQALARFADAVLRVAVTYVDEIILAYNIRVRSDNPWDTSKDALILYAQNSGLILKNAVWLAVFMYLAAFIIFLVMIAPAAALLYVLPGDWSSFGFVLALVFAWSLKQAILEPFAITCLMQVYFKAIEGQQPDPVWDERLSAASGRFREMKERAIDWARGRSSAYSLSRNNS